MSKTTLTAIGILCAATASANAVDEVANIKLKGYLGERLDAMIERHVIGTDVDYISATLPLGPHHANPEGANPATVFFCDYASAGNLWRRENYYRTWFPVEIPPESR